MTPIVHVTFIEADLHGGTVMNIRFKIFLVLGITLLNNGFSASQKPNSYLASKKYAITHFDSSQSDLMPYPAKKGVFHMDPTSFPRVISGPVSIMTLASTSPNYMWAVSSQGVSYVDISNGGLKELASTQIPGIPVLSEEILKKGLHKKFSSLSDVEKVVKDWKIDWTRMANGVYSFVDRDNNVYYNTFDKRVFVFGLKDPKNPTAGIEIKASRDFKEMMGEKEGLAGLSLTYDGKLVVVGNNSLSILNRDLKGEPYTFKFNPDEYVSNSVAIDDKNGIYVASDKNMRKLVWMRTKISEDSKDGAWISPYDSGREPNSVKFGTGTGSTPTLMGFGKDEDRLVLITDGADRMKLIAFWRDQIPQDYKKIDEVNMDRIAGVIPVTCGLKPLPEFIQSEQSVVVDGYGAFVVNNIRKEGAKDRLVDVLAGGPVFDPPKGVERFQWSTTANSFLSVWTRNDVVSTSMVPAVSGPSEIVFVNGYTKEDGWEVTGMDWKNGKTVHRTIFGQSNFGNGAYSIVQFLENGDLLFNSVGGVTRIQYGMEKLKQAEEAK